jgi:hypothetical protein
MSIRDVLISEIIPDMKGTKGGSSGHTTLEAHHQQKMRSFGEQKAQLALLKKEVVEKRAAQRKAAAHTDEWQQLADAIDLLKIQIAAIEADANRLDYFLDVGDMLFQYYDAQDSLANGTDISVKNAPIRMPANSVLSYFMEEPVIGDAIRHVAEPKKTKKASNIESKDGLNRDKMLERYLAVVEPSAIKSGIMPGSGIEPGWGCCPTCDVEMTFYQNEALLGCPKCGYEEFILVDSEKPSYKDPPREITYFAYRKINHFNEWLAQFQAKENTDIPQIVIDSVMHELYKERISDPKKVKKEKIRDILQKLKMSKMYDHVQQIKNRIQHQMTNLTLSKDMEEKLQHMFKEIQPAFIKYCPADRSNFLSYPYVLYKFCQLLEMDEFLPCFQLLKSREKLYEQDCVWQKICDEMRWEFIRSI